MNANTHAQQLMRPEDLPRGISAVRALPHESLDALWDSIIVADDIKERLLSQAILNFALRPKVSRDQLPMHGVILLVGPRAPARPPWRAAWLANLRATCPRPNRS